MSTTQPTTNERKLAAFEYIAKMMASDGLDACDRLSEVASAIIVTGLYRPNDGDDGASEDTDPWVIRAEERSR